MSVLGGLPALQASGIGALLMALLIKQSNGFDRRLDDGDGRIPGDWDATAGRHD
jgi:hypothetical protein